MTDPSALYPPVVLDHARNPRRAALPEPADTSARRDNPLCGDRATVGVRLSDMSDGARTIANVGCRARGCALCVASGSMMCEAVVGASAAQARQLASAFVASITPGAAPAGHADSDLGPLAAFAPLAGIPQRARCALLPWEALLAALDAPPRQLVDKPGERN